MGGGGGGQQQTTTTSIDPSILPYVKDILSQGQKLYQSQTPTFFPGQTYVSPSEATQQALQMAKERALGGSPLVKAAQQEQLATIQGQGPNPFLAGALQAQAAPLTQNYQEAMRGLESKVSAGGRYGSDAMAQLAQRQAQGYGTGLGNAMANLAYNSSEAQAQRQQQAALAAPTMANADYADIQKLLTAGQMGEGYQSAQLQDAMNRFNFQQNLPYQKLQQYAGLITGLPQGSQTTSTATPTGGK
jgi:hypothetical protein